MQLIFRSLEHGVRLIYGINFESQKHKKILHKQSGQMKVQKRRRKGSVWEDGRQSKGKIIKEKEAILNQTENSGEAMYM